jgi:hypothetical protein
METGTIVMMVLTFGLIWGGFSYLLIKMLRQMRKSSDQ